MKITYWYCGFFDFEKYRCKNVHVKHNNSLHMGSKYNSGTQYEPLDHIETDHYHIAILFILYHRCASMLCFGDFNHNINLIYLMFNDLFF